ncbi:hypothetical protein AYI70_g7501 [Smittium culicis]|uniref:Uncharacterized protein n=1 Tax=Smittium culicis TaxID=133412 RepID=A0A1R1XK91_9FUNG|nr:hypothetical protein AYI70_g7501 [Smittium culicis]
MSSIFINGLLFNTKLLVDLPRLPLKPLVPPFSRPLLAQCLNPRPLLFKLPLSRIFNNLLLKHRLAHKFLTPQMPIHMELPAPCPRARAHIRLHKLGRRRKRICRAITPLLLKQHLRIRRLARITK